jgi:hypothetical protein
MRSGNSCPSHPHPRPRPGMRGTFGALGGRRASTSGRCAPIPAGPGRRAGVRGARASSRPGQRVGRVCNGPLGPRGEASPSTSARPGGVYCAKISWTRLRTRSRAAREEKAPSIEHRGGPTAPWERGRLARWCAKRTGTQHSGVADRRHAAETTIADAALRDDAATRLRRDGKRGDGEPARSSFLFPLSSFLVAESQRRRSRTVFTIQ